MEITSEFNIGDVVKFKDDFHFNPATKTISIGKVESIHFHRGTDVFGNGNQGGGNFTYGVSGFNYRPGEDELELYDGKPFTFNNRR